MVGSAIDGDRAVLELTAVYTLRQLVRALVLHGEDPREVRRLPGLDDPVEHPRSVGRIREGDLEAAFRERGRERQRVALEYPCAFAQAQQPDVRAQRMEARRPRLDEV